MVSIPRGNHNYKYKYCKFEVDPPIATFTISNPDLRNSYYMKTHEGLENAVQVVRERDDIRVLILTGDPAGKTFCAGASVKSMAKRAAPDKDVPGLKAYGMTEEYDPQTKWAQMQRDKGALLMSDVPPDAPNEAYSRWKWWIESDLRGGYFQLRQTCLMQLPKPVIAMVNGMGAWGAGADLALHCDMIVMSDQASFTWNYVYRTVVPLEGACFFLPKLVGYHRAMELIMTGRPLKAREAYDWGIVNYVVPEAELKDFTTNLAQRVAESAPPMNMAVNKYVIQIAQDDWIHKLERIRDELLRPLTGWFIGSDDMKEAQMAFVQKRKPIYKGR